MVYWLATGWKMVAVGCLEIGWIGGGGTVLVVEWWGDDVVK